MTSMLQQLYQMLTQARMQDDVDRIKLEIQRKIAYEQGQKFWAFAEEGKRK